MCLLSLVTQAWLLKDVQETACERKEDRSSSGESEADTGSVLFSCMLQEWSRREARVWEREDGTDRKRKRGKRGRSGGDKQTPLTGS